MVRDLVDLAMEWTSGVDGDLWFARQTPVRGIARHLQARLAEDDGRPFAEVHRQGASEERRVRFSMHGHVTLEERSSSVVHERRVTLRSAWLRWLSRVDRSATTGDVGSGLASRAVELGRGGLNPWYYPTGAIATTVGCRMRASSRC